MNTTELRWIAFAAVSTATIGKALVETTKTVRKERANRAAIEKNKNLDVAAIHRAQARLSEKLDDGYRPAGVLHLLNDFQDEIDFQKIAIREEG